ncbi:MAG: DUF4363 family protein [Clostridiales bacterium]|nr:DUF4363 family protein [Clostridiales bacterium]
MNFKLIVVIVLLVLLLGGGIYESIYVSKTLGKLNEQIDDIIAMGEPYSADKIKDIIEWWQGKSNILAMTVSHTPLTEVTFTLNELLGTVEAEDYKSSTAILYKLVGFVDSLKESYSFSANHII